MHCDSNKSYQNLMHDVAEYHIKTANIWQNTKFVVLSLKIHYNFGNRFWKVNSKIYHLTKSFLSLFGFFQQH